VSHPRPGGVRTRTCPCGASRTCLSEADWEPWSFLCYDVYDRCYRLEPWKRAGSTGSAQTPHSGLRKAPVRKIGMSTEASILWRLELFERINSSGKMVFAKSLADKHLSDPSGHDGHLSRRWPTSAPALHKLAYETS
jgi:hypothetical protein